jgi:regulator of sirC expression with transglutaminase-like and TPR domain
MGHGFQPVSALRLTVPSALDYFASLVAEDQGLALLEAAVAIAQDEVPELDVQQVLMQIDTLSLRLRQRIPEDASPLQRLRLLNRFFFQDLGFGGNVNDYYDLRNSYLHEVLVTRRGIPISLSLLYMEFAQQAGLTARGVSFPGHFLVKLRLPRGEVVIDPFNGISLSREDLEERLGPYRRQRGLVGDFDAPLGLFLQAAPPRDILARLLRNLKEIHRSSEDFERLLAVQNRLVILLPQIWEERRDRGLVLAELGADDLAAQDLSVYLEHCASAEDAPALTQRLAELRRAGSHRLH